MRVVAPILAFLLAAGAARAQPASEPAPASRPDAPTSPERTEPTWQRMAGFGVELGGSPGVFGAKLGGGEVLEGDVPTRRWMLWLEADGTDWFRPDRPASPGRVDRLLWFYPHLELARQLVHRPALLGWIRAGPTIGRYTVDSGASQVWFPGLAVGAGVLLSPVRLGVTFYGQWRSTTASTATPLASPDVRIEPMVLVTAGMELLTPLR